MKPSVQVRNYHRTSNIAPQGQRRSHHSCPKPKIPDDSIKAEMQAALENLKQSGNAAFALMMLDAAEIRYCSEISSDWEEFDCPEFRNGIFELAKATASNFRTAVIKFENEVREFITPAKNPDQNSLPHLGNIYLEDACCALRHLVFSFSNLTSNRSVPGHQIAHTEGNLISDRITEAFDRLWRVRAELIGAFNLQKEAAL